MCRAYRNAGNFHLSVYCWAAFFNPVTDEELAALSTIQTGRADRARGYFQSYWSFADAKIALFKDDGYVSDHPKLLAEIARLEQFRAPIL